MNLTTPRFRANGKLVAGTALGKFPSQSQAYLFGRRVRALLNCRSLGLSEDDLEDTAMTGAEAHECDEWRTGQVAERRHSGARPLVALDDLHRAVGLRRGAVMAIRPDPPDGRLRQDLHFDPDRHPLYRHLRSLFLANAGDCTGGRGRTALPRDPVGA